MLNRRQSLRRAPKNSFLTAICFSIGVISILAQTGSVSDHSASAEKSSAVRADLTFDVVSIRPSNAGPNQWHLAVPTDGDRYEAIGMPLGTTIQLAFFAYRMSSKDRIIGAPAWVWDDEYDLVGTVNEAELPSWRKLTRQGLMAPNGMLETMLQNALADRCKLAVHRVPTTIEGYALVVSNHGPNRKNLVQSKPDEVIPDRAVKISLDARVVPIYSDDNPVLHFYQTSMAALVLFISGSAPVEDRTGLSGKYRFDLTRLATEGIPSSDWDLASLGLKLIPAKIPSEKIVIDHIERPSPN
jgi:uncharacterized protein (TIGR03435 family)